MNFGANFCPLADIIDRHLTGTGTFMKNTLKILLLSLGILIAACNTASTEKSSADENSAPPSNTEKTENSADKTDSKFPLAPSAIMTADVKMIDGGNFKLEDAKGKVILFNLWATWCGPCRQEMPELIEMQNKYRDQGFEIIGLNTDDETLEKINPFVEQMKLNYKIGWADEAMMKEFMRISKIAAIPQSFLIDREGRLRGVFVGGGPTALEPMKKSLDKVINE